MNGYTLFLAMFLGTTSPAQLHQEGPGPEVAAVAWATSLVRTTWQKAGRIIIDTRRVPPLSQYRPMAPAWAGDRSGTWIRDVARRSDLVPGVAEEAIQCRAPDPASKQPACTLAAAAALAFSDAERQPDGRTAVRVRMWERADTPGPVGVVKREYVLYLAQTEGGDWIVNNFELIYIEH